VDGLSESSDVLDMGNSGTGARLLMGLVAAYNFTTFFSGDDSLRSRPMQRVVDPLLQMGVRFHSRSKGRLPLALIGSGDTMPIEYIMPVDSAQVKSAILLAGLNTAGKTTVIEQKPTRDHTEKMLAYFGWQLETEKLENGGIAISMIGKQALQRKDYKITVPGDPSSAAFLAVAALIVPGADITIENITVNPLRIGLYTTLQEMGANIEFINKRIEAGEEVADIRVRYSKLQGVTVPGSRSPSMIDEYPILAVAASYATGKTIMHGLSELKVKESDRLTAIASGLKQCGVNVEIEGNDLMIEGCEQPYGGATITTNFDHRIAMSFLVMGMASKNEVKIDDASSITTSFPNFVELMNRLGANMYFDASDVVGQEKYKPLTIAIDGPAASGKGTLARRIAEHFGYSYLDTGSIYR
ncbi:MAG: 3-phosphoshikimate 1-carboxyvinyltransferase, partial [Pseudomonadota bacterium]